MNGEIEGSANYNMVAEERDRLAVLVGALQREEERHKLRANVAEKELGKLTDEYNRWHEIALRLGQMVHAAEARVAQLEIILSETAAMLHISCHKGDFRNCTAVPCRNNLAVLRLDDKAPEREEVFACGVCPSHLEPTEVEAHMQKHGSQGDIVCNQHPDIKIADLETFNHHLRIRHTKEST